MGPAETEGEALALGEGLDSARDAEEEECEDQDEVGIFDWHFHVFLDGCVFVILALCLLVVEARHDESENNWGRNILRRGGG